MATRHHPLHDQRVFLDLQAATFEASFEIVDPVEEDRFWQRYFRTEPYFDPRRSYEDYGPAYRVGIAHRLGQEGHAAWWEVEDEARLLWRRHKGFSRLSWAQAADAIRAAWCRVDKALSWRH